MGVTFLQNVLYISANLHGITYPKTLFFVVATVRTSDLIDYSTILNSFGLIKLAGFSTSWNYTVCYKAKPRIAGSIALYNEWLHGSID